MKASILVPLRPERGPQGKVRLANWKWIRRRWEAHFPEAEIIVGTDDGEQPFSKTQAINDAYRRSMGDVLILADADSWVDMPQVVRGIAYAQQLGVLVVPWTTAHRLGKDDTRTLRAAEPSDPSLITSGILSRADDYRPSPSTAAMVVIVARESFERVGGMDPRFRGWGQEDVAFGLACATLLGRSHIMPGLAYALHHERPRKDGMRVWQDDPGTHNAALGDRYWQAKGFPDRMLALAAEHALPGKAVSVRPGADLRPVDQYVPIFEPVREALPAGVLVREFLGASTEGDRIAL